MVQVVGQVLYVGGAENLAARTLYYRENVASFVASSRFRKRTAFRMSSEVEIQFVQNSLDEAMKRAAQVLIDPQGVLRRFRGSRIR